jgi:hypothetical protein
MFESSKVLNLKVKMRDGVAKKQSYASQSSGTSAVCHVAKYAAPFVYDFSPCVVYVVDIEGQVFTSQTSSAEGFGNPYQ